MLKSFLLTKLTNLSSEWKVGRFFIELRKFVQSMNYFKFLVFFILNFSLFIMKVYYKVKQNEQRLIYSNLFTPDLNHVILYMRMCKAQGKKRSKKGLHFIEDDSHLTL